jgi:drug/metabolite transporter (DMT)-like permease
MSAAAFGTLAVLAKLGYEAGAGPIPLLAMRFLVAGVLLLAFQKLRGRALAPDMRTVIRLMLLGGLGYGFEASLFFTALTKAPAGVVSLIFFSYPLLTNVLGLATGLETFKPRLALALALGTTGVAFIFSFTTADRTGLLLALGAALAVAVYFLAAQVVMKGVQPAVSATWTSLGAAVATGIAAVVSGQSFPIGALPAAAALGLATVVAFIFLYAAIERIGSSRAAVAQMFEPVVTVVLGALILSEELTWRIAVGAALVVSALPMLTSGGHGDDVPCAPDSL